MEAHEISKNNNNIDKPLNANETGVSHSTVNPKECKTSSVNQHMWNQVPHSLGETFRVYPGGNLGASVRPSSATDAGPSKSGSFLRNNSRSGPEDARAGLHSYNQSPTISRTVSEPKGSVVLHGTSGSIFFTTTVQSSARKESTFQSLSLTDPLKSASSPVSVSAISTYSASCPSSQSHMTGIGAHSATADLSRQEVASSLSRSSIGSVHHKTAFSTHSGTQNEMELNHAKSTKSHSVYKAAEDASEHFKNISSKGGDSRASTTSFMHSSGLPESKLLSVSSTNLPLFPGLKPPFAADQAELTQSLRPSPVHLTAVGDYAEASPHKQSCDDRDNQAATSLFSSERRAAPKLSKKAHSRSPKPKFHQAAQVTADDEDDDNDFIPVGMLQLSSLKRPEDNGTAVANIEFLSGDKNVGTVYQLNQGLNVIYKQQMESNRGLVQGAENPGVEELTGCVQEKLKQKVQQHKLKQQASGGQEQSLQLQSVTAQKQQDLRYDPQRRQLFMKLVQHAQQQQKQLQDQQQKQLQDQQQKQLQDQQQKQLQDQQQKQLQDQQQRQLQDQQHNLHHSQSTLSPATSDQSKSPGFLKNQGLIIHHHQAQDINPTTPGVQTLNQQKMARGQEMRSEQSGDQQCLLEHNAQQLAEVNFKNPEKSLDIENSRKQQQRDQRYSKQHPASACPTEPSVQLQQQTAAMHQEPPWQVQPSNIPKIAERLLQQSLSEQMVHQVRTDQVLAYSKSEQMAQSLSHNISVSRSDHRPMTPHHAMPSVNQQHPEIARMLSSPVSPRQPASPRQAVSPRRIASPTQLSATSSQFGHQNLAIPHSRQSVGLNQPANSKPLVSSMNSSSSYSASLKQAVSSDSRLNSHSSTLMEQLASTGQTSQSDEQSDMQLPAGRRKFEQTRIDPIQPTEKPQYSQTEQQPGEGRAQQVTADRQHVGADACITLPNSDAHNLNTLQSIPFSQTVQSFSPGQIIHYRPPENTNVQSKALTVHKSQPSLLVQFPSPTVSSTKSPTPLTQTASSAWHLTPDQVDSQMTIQLHTPLSHSSEPVNVQRSDTRFKALQTNQPHDRKQLAEYAVENQPQHLSEIQVRGILPGSLPVNSVSQSYQDKYDVQPKPPSMPFVQPASTHIDISSASSYMSSANNRHFQTIANLTEKEASFLQSLFASSPSVDIDERFQRHSSQEPHTVPQMQASHSGPLEEPTRSEDSLKFHSAAVTLYPEMRKNEGGLKVLSEIASKRYALDVAGKEDDAEQQASCTSAEDTAQNAPQSSQGLPQVAAQSEQASANEATVNSMADSVSDTERVVVTQQKTGDAQAKTNTSFEAKSDNSDSETKSLGREAKDSTITHSETPRREVRQRKPKKPFEQEEVPVKRPPKASPQKNIPFKKQTQAASAQNSTHKKGHNQREKAAEVKLKEEIEKEDNKGFVRQTRSAMDNRLAECEKRDHVMEEGEDVKQGEFDSPSRRLSRRLLKKEKELLQQKKAEEHEGRVSTRQQPSRINIREEASDENVSPTTTKSSRHVSIPSADDSLLAETSERMRTRSRNRSADDKVVSGGKTMNSQDQSSQCSTEQKKPTNSSITSTPNAATVSSNKENRRETRNTSKSPGHESQSSSPARLAQTAPIALTRMATRQKVVEVEHSRSSIGVKNKRLLPPAPAEELVHWQKRVKKLDIPTVVLEPFKLPEGKPGMVKEETQKDIAKDKEVAVKEVTKPENEIVKVKHSKKKKQKSKKKRNRKKPAQTTAKEDQNRSENDYSEDGDMVVVGNAEESQGNGFVSDPEHELNSDGHEVAEATGERSLSQTADENTEKVVTSSKNSDHEDVAMDTVQQEAKEAETNRDARKDYMDSSETEEQTHRASKEVLQTAEATPESSTTEQQSVIKCTSAFVPPADKGKEPPHSIVPSSASAKACPLPNDKSISHTTLAGERRKMVMYKLVPVLEGDTSHSEECLIPFRGFLISNGNCDHVLIPDDLMHKPALTTSSLSSSSAAAAGFDTPSSSSSSSSSSVGNSSTLVTLETSDMARSAMLPSSRALSTNLLAPEVVSTSGSAFEWLPTVYSPMKLGKRTASETMPVPAAWASQSPGLSVPGVSNLSAWTPQWSSCSSQTTPAPSAGEPSPVVVASKSRMSTAVAQPSQPQYRPSESWNTTPASMPSSSSSSLSPFPITSSVWDSSASVPPPAPEPQQCEQVQSWTAASHQPPQNSSWSSSPCVTETALESWSKEYFPNVAFTNSRADTQLHQPGSAPQAVLPTPAYSMETGASQQTQMYASNHNHTVSSGAPFSTGGTPQDTEFGDGRQDSLIQSYLRQVASNPGGFSQELAGFNLGQQDLAYLESRLRQSLSPNTLFNAMAAYDDVSGQGTIVGHDNSLQESINLVHTVNLDMEEGHLDGSNNLDLSDLRNNLASSLTMSRNLDGHRTSQSNREETQDDDGSWESARNRDSLTRQDGTVLQEGSVAASGVLKGDGKKPIRERKSQYEIVTQDDMKRYRCLLCDKNFGVATIYRHLRTHDPDYKVTCSICAKQYTQKQSLIVHWQKTHGDHTPPPGLMKSPKYEELPSSEPSQVSHGKPPGSQLKSPDSTLLKASGAVIRSPGTHIKSPGDPKCQRRTSSTSDNVAAAYDKIGVSMQEAAHQQVEELRRMKAEKKLAAAQRKTDDPIGDDGIASGEGLLQGISESTRLSDEAKLEQTDKAKNLLDFAKNHIEHSAVVYEQAVSQKTSFPGSAVTSRVSTSAGEDYADLEVVNSLNLSDNQFHFSSPTFMPTVPQFHADNIPKPISTPVVKSNCSTEPSCSKEAMSVEDKSHFKAVTIDGKYACELCNTLLNTKGTYISHMRRHNKSKTKFCSYCSKDFHTLQELRSHERTHTGERPYKCEICHTMFAHSGSYVSHKKSHEKRGELEPFPIIDGRIEYPSTFKKPRLSGGIEGGGEKAQRVKKKKVTVPAIKSEQPNENPDHGNQQMSGVIQRNNMDNLHEQSDCIPGEFTADVRGQWQNQQRLASEHFRPNVASPGVGDRKINSDTLRVGATPQSMVQLEQGNQGFVPQGEDYTSSSGNVSTDYYSSAVGYSQNMVQPEFLPPQTDNTSSPHGFFKQDKYTPRASNVDTYSMASQNQVTSVPANVAAEKSLQFAGSYSNNGQGSKTYYSQQQQQYSSEYPYSVPGQSGDYQQDDFDESLAQYKNDPSSSEIVKKLLQHYNVPASTFHDAVPIDYSHQIPDESEYSHGGGSEYSGMDIGRSTPAPPSYSASIISQQKLYYNSQSISSGYGSNMLRQQQPLVAQDQASLNLHDSRQHQLLQSLASDGQFGSPYSQGQQQDVYSSDDRYSSSHSNQSTRFASPSLP